MDGMQSKQSVRTWYPMWWMAGLDGGSWIVDVGKGLGRRERLLPGSFAPELEVRP